MTIPQTLRQTIWIGGVVIGLLLCWLALQRPISFTLDIGGDLQRGAADEVSAPVYDAPYLEGVHAPEPATLDVTTTETYRWSYPQATIHVPGLGGGSWATALRIAPPADTQPALTLSLNQQPLHVALPSAARTLHLLTPPDRTGAVTLDLQAPAYLPPGDQRELGVRLEHLAIAPLTTRLYLPWTLLGALGGTLILLGAGALLSGLRPRVTAAIVLAVGAAMALTLSLERTTLTIFAGTLLAVSAAALLVLLVGRSIGWELARNRPLDRREVALVAGLTALAFGIRLAGLRHPQANFSDLQLHVNNLEEVTAGRVIFTEGLPCRAGGGRSPYPPGTYLVLLPFQLLTPSSAAHRLVVQAGNTLLDALTIPLLWAALRQVAGPGSRIPLLAAALYLLPLPMLRAMNIGEFANVGGQALALPAVLGLALWLGTGTSGRWRAPLLVALLVAALSHSGVLISVALWGACCWLLLLAQRRWQVAWQLSWLGGAALLTAAVLYYSAFLGDPTLRGTNPDCPVPTPLLAKLSNLGRSVISPDSLTPPWLMLLGAVGAALAPRRLPALALPLQAWLLAALLSQVSLLWSEQTVRWQHFVFPALCIGGGITLAALYERRGWGRWTATLMLSFVLIAALVFWIAQIATYRTGLFL